MGVSRSGPEYWNDLSTVSAWLEPCESWESPIATMEEPAFWRLAGDVAGLRVLDLGCGDGRLGAEMLERGAYRYHGVDPSTPLLEHGRSVCSERVTFASGTIEGVDLEAAAFDLVVARLVLHYVADLESSLAKMMAATDRAGAVVYTIEHPVVTSHESDLSRDEHGLRSRWVVDNYFKAGARELDWFAGRVTKYHRPLSDHFRAAAACGSRIASIDEARPVEELFDGHHDEYQRRCRIPLFLCVRAEHSATTMREPCSPDPSRRRADFRVRRMR